MAGQKQISKHTFTDGINTVTADEYMPANQASYILNCNVISTATGDVGVVTNIKGNLQIPFTLPAGQNKCIGTANDEEAYNFYFAIWNSNKLHTWYRYNSIDKQVTLIIQNLTDTKNITTFVWNEGEMILHIDIVRNNLIYWTIKGDVARKINIKKCLDKTSAGYGVDIDEEFTRAYKRTSNKAPKAEFKTDTNIKFNRLYGYQFKFMQLWVYDDYERSNYSDISNLAVPEKEAITGIKFVRNTNNLIEVTLNTGKANVDIVEIAMIQTNPDGGAFDWVTIANLNKKKLGIADNADYVFKFYNDGVYPVCDKEKVIRPFSYLPDKPLCQSFVKNAMVYTNFFEGFDVVPIDITLTTQTQDLTIEAGTVNKPNAPSITQQQQSIYRNVRGGFIWGDCVDRGTVTKFTIGADVVTGNKFEIYSPNSEGKYFAYTATALDTASTVAIQLRAQMQNNPGNGSNRSLSDVIPEGGGNYSWVQNWQSNCNGSYLDYQVTVNPKNYNLLKDTGENKINIKSGSSFKYGIMYEDADGRKSLTYTNDKLINKIPTINEQGGNKLITISLNINHIPPIDAFYMQVVRTNNLVYKSFIQILIQKAITVVGTSADNYLDLVIGSLYTLQKLHENTTLKYNFTKGDRIRLIKKIKLDDATVTYYPFYEAEIISYKDTVVQKINQTITLNGTNTVTVDSASVDNIASFLLVNGVEREIIGAGAGSYTLANTIAGGGGNGTDALKFNYFEIVNRNGVLRIKKPSNVVSADNPVPIEILANATVMSIVEIYTPAKSDIESKQFYEFGEKYAILNAGTENRMHSGNIQSQTETQPAIIKFSTGNNYVRNREMPTNNVVPNTQIVITDIEDASYSDFYISDFNQNGRPNAENIGRGKVYFGSRSRFSNNSIEDTTINGLNDFDNTDREDYNDKYGNVKRTIFYQGRLYVWKDLKTGWIPVNQSIINDASNQTIVGLSSKLLNNIQYFAYEGGIGNNPEAITQNGTQLYYALPTHGLIIRLSGDGETPISEIYQLDNKVKQYFQTSLTNKTKVIFGYDIQNNILILSFEVSKNVIYSQALDQYGWNIYDQPLSNLATWTIITPPANGTLNLTDPLNPIYMPNLNFLGSDSFFYKGSTSAVIKKMCISIIENPNRIKRWRGKGAGVCSTIDRGNLTWVMLEEYFIDDNTPTGLEKPNDINDSDYVYPIYDIITCPLVGNQVQMQTFRRNNCQNGYGGTYAYYTVNANTYFANTQTDANNLALADILANGQNFVNANGYCVIDTVVSNIVIDIDNNVESETCLYCSTTGVNMQNLIVSAVAGESHYQPVGVLDTTKSYLLSSGNIGGQPQSRRYGINLINFILNNPSIGAFEFIIRGKRYSGTGLAGAYVLKNINQGQLVMGQGGTPIVDIPTVTNPNNVGKTFWNNNSVGAGADGTVGITVGDVVLRLTYTVSTNTLTSSYT